MSGKYRIGAKLSKEKRGGRIWVIHTLWNRRGEWGGICLRIFMEVRMLRYLKCPFYW